MLIDLAGVCRHCGAEVVVTVSDAELRKHLAALDCTIDPDAKPTPMDEVIRRRLGWD
jgi:hypothetical protein